MPKKPDKDLFRESTMTFGEHLEELRSSLFKALLWLVGGFLLGLFVATPVVHFIERPVEGALKEHYKRAAIKKLDDLREKGLPLPGSPEQLAELVEEEDVLPEMIYLQPKQVLGQIQTTYQQVDRQRTEVLDQFETAAPLLERMGPTGDKPQKKLSEEERSQVSDALEQLRLAHLSAEDPKKGLTSDGLDRILEAFNEGKSFTSDDLARVVGAVKRQEDRIREELARVAVADDLLDRTRLPSKGPEEKLLRDDLAQIFIWKPIENDPRITTKALGVTEGFMIWVKAALLVGVLIASPGIFYHIWSFVAAGLYGHERRFIYVFGPFSLFLFFLGAALVFFVVFQLVLKFLFTFNEMLGIGIEPRITEWLGFVLILPLGFGIAFQLPLVMLFLQRIGVFDVETYLSKWRIAILVIAVLSMLLTPADPGSMMMMAIPLTVLYFGGILLCHFMPRSRRRYDEEPED